MRIENIVKNYLIENNFDGLYNENYPCACEINNLFPCGFDGQILNCSPGYKLIAKDCECNRDECITFYQKNKVHLIAHIVNKGRDK